ncbi:hypothetical protein [Natronomonas marina]|uniref:hypothetical protein n=1 Tax=Natronomonas marina TaxID=2961939 RepID=UPI0020C95FED|nr:hypothetical protein [Natronomonas marina]
MSDDPHPLVDAIRRKLSDIETAIRGDRDVVEVEEIVEEKGDLLTRVDELESQLAAVESQLDSIQDLGQEKSTKEEKIAAVVQYAQNAADDPKTGRVALKATDVKGVTGVSRRYAYDLMDGLPDEYEWALDRSDVSQYGELEIDQQSQDRALIIDLELLHSDEGAVNKFTTRTSRKEASA